MLALRVCTPHSDNIFTALNKPRLHVCPIVTRMMCSMLGGWCWGPHVAYVPSWRLPTQQNTQDPVPSGSILFYEGEDVLSALAYGKTL